MSRAPWNMSRQRHATRVPARRDGDPDELGAVIAFLASEPAGYITGALVPVDGGMLQSLG